MKLKNKMAINQKTIKAYALKNAIEHDGKAVVGSVISGLFNQGLKKDKIKGVIPEINKVLSEINKLSLDEQKKEFSKLDKLVGKLISYGMLNKNIISRLLIGTNICVACQSEYTSRVLIKYMEVLNKPLLKKNDIPIL